MSKTTTLPHAFFYISLPSLHNYDVKCPNFELTWERERQGDTFYSLSLSLGRGPLSSVPTKLPHLHVTGWLGVREKKLQRKRNPFFSDVFIRFVSGYLAFRISEALSGAQRSTIGEKIWLSMHPRNFGSDKIVRTYVHPFMLGCEMTNQLARSPRHILLVFKFGIGHPCYGQLTAVKKGIRWPVSHDCIVSSGI